MLTRALLLLLAMMTGLSAAQAEERSRLANGRGAVEASRLLEAVDQIAEVRVAGHHALLSKQAAVTPLAPLWASTPTTYTAPTTHRSDRARE